VGNWDTLHICIFNIKLLKYVNVKCVPPSTMFCTFIKVIFIGQMIVGTIFVTITDNLQHTHNTIELRRNEKMKTFLFAGLAAVLFMLGLAGFDSFGEINAAEPATGEVTDIDGNRYVTVKIGDQWWMAENLKVTHYRNGDAIPKAKVQKVRAKWDTMGVYCSYNNDPASASTYGHLYNWYAVNDSRGLAPKGWHVPTDAEWQKLIDHLGGNAGGKMKKTTLWMSSSPLDTNESGFSALPGGFQQSHGSFNGIELCAKFFTSTESSGHVVTRVLMYRRGGVSREKGDRQGGYSVRCVRD
jgi:uncharacterized protein (TIGR02145 family)